MADGELRVTGPHADAVRAVLHGRFCASDPDGPGVDLRDVVAAVGRGLGVDRCWLYARDPRAGRGIALVRWRRDTAAADVPEDVRRWTAEDPDLRTRDPLFGRALGGAPLDVVEDTTHADVDRELEQALGHRAFVHLNLHHDGALWGTLQPGDTAASRAWSAAERDALLALRAPLAAVVAALVRARGEDLRSRLVEGA